MEEMPAQNKVGPGIGVVTRGCLLERLFGGNSPKLLRGGPSTAPGEKELRHVNHWGGLLSRRGRKCLRNAEAVSTTHEREKPDTSAQPS